MLLGEIFPNIRVANIFTLDGNMNDDTFNQLKTIDCRIFYILSGTGKIIVENEQFSLSAGSIILFQSGTEYCWQPDERGIKYVAINFDYTQNFVDLKESFHPLHAKNFSDEMILERINFSNAKALNKPIYLKGKKSLENRFRLIATEFYMDSNYSNELVSSELKSLIINIVRELAEVQSGNENNLVRKIVEYIQNNFNKQISNEVIAGQFGFHPTYLNRVFKQQTGESMHSFVKEYRISIAADLLKVSNLSVDEITEQTGFNDVPHFIKTFKKRFGTTPAKFRKQDQGDMH